MTSVSASKQTQIEHPSQREAGNGKRRIRCQFKKKSLILFSVFSPNACTEKRGRCVGLRPERNKLRLFRWKQGSRPELPFLSKKGPGGVRSNPTLTSATFFSSVRVPGSPGWRGGRGGTRGTGSRARHSCSPGSTCCTRSCARPRASCIDRRSSSTAAASATAATAGSQPRRTRLPPAAIRNFRTRTTKKTEQEKGKNRVGWALHRGAASGSVDPERRRFIVYCHF
jgi:hypothetical protein